MGAPSRGRALRFCRATWRNLSVPLVWLPSCAWPMTRLLIDNPYTWNGRRRAHRGLQKIDTIEKNQQDRTDGLEDDPDREKAAAVSSSTPSAPDEVARQEVMASSTPPVESDPDWRKRRGYRAQLRPHGGSLGKRRWSHPAHRLRAIPIGKRRRRYRAHLRSHRNGKR